MKKWIAFVLALAGVTFFLLNREDAPSQVPYKKKKKREGTPAAFVEARARYEFDLVKDPRTGTIPEGIREKEMALARTLPEREGSQPAVAARLGALNTYIPAGPHNIGGRTRAVAYDVRFNGSSNRVIIAGCVSGGIMRSVDGGLSWTLVTPQNDIHSFTALAQDPRAGFQDTWYAAGGEFMGNTASDIGAPYLGYGLWKSVDGGASWSKIAVQGALESFDNAFDIVHRLAVHPLTGHLYVAAHGQLVRSTTAGASFQTVFSFSATSSTRGQLDVAISSAGTILMTVNGSAAAASRGVWVSATGDANSFTRIAGGTTVGVDSVDGWRANSYLGAPKRILASFAPSNGSIAYIFYENGLSSDPPALQPEADLFRLSISGSTYTWSNRSANMPDFEAGNLSGSDPLAVQNGYDMMVRVKPDDPNTVFIGGTNLYRSTNGFATRDATSWIGGYNTNFSYAQYPNSHADIHELAFNPVNPAQAVCGNDGGIQFTSNIMAPAVTWNVPRYQTLQYYYVAMDPDAGRNNFAGGAQDNGVRFRDKLGILGTAAADSNNHELIFSADGTAVGISRLNLANQVQYLYGSYQLGNIFRYRLTAPQQLLSIRPNNLTPNEQYGSGFGEFVTNFRLDPENTEDLYYVNFNRLFRTTAASSVTAGGWTELEGVGSFIGQGSPSNPISIRAMGFSRGPYLASHALYLGTTNGRIIRIDDPRNFGAGSFPVDISPSALTGNVQDIAVNPNDDNEILAVVSNYNTISIWRTANAKSPSPNWQNLEGNLALPSIRSCAIVVKKDAAGNALTEYYVGTSVGLYSTTDISGSPVWLREGGDLLNFAVIPSIAYRPADNVMVIGTHGNGMYYTYLGTPNFTPNAITGVTPVTNDRNFISAVMPTVATTSLQYRVGNVSGIGKMELRVTDMSGRLVYRREVPYANGSIPVSSLSGGAYILNIYSRDNRYRHVQKFTKQ